MIRFSILLILCSIVNFVHAQSDINSIYKIEPEKVQQVIWKDIAKINLPHGIPILKKSQQVNNYKPSDVMWTSAGKFKKSSSNLSFTHLENVIFKHNNTNSSLPNWSNVKSAEYELNTLYDIRHFSARQGLPTGSIYKTLQTEDGHVWLATNGEGICQYIADHFRCLKSENGLNNNRVWDIEIDTDKRLWLATDKGINVFNGKYFESVYIDEQVFSEKVHDIVVIGSRTYFISEDALYLYKDDKFYHIDTSEIQGRLNTLTTLSNTVVMNTASGLFSIKEDKLTAFKIENNACYGNINTALELENYLVFSIKNSGLCRLDINNNKVSKLNGINANNILVLLYEKHNKTLWVGDDSKGVTKIQNTKAVTFNEQNGLSDQNIRSLMKDAQNHIWVSTYSNGINRINSAGFNLLNKHNGIRNERVSALKVINNKIWIGSYGSGIQVLDENEWHELKVSLPNEHIHAIAQDNSGRVWVGSRQGAIVLGEENSEHIWQEQGLNADIVHQFTVAPNGAVYLATDKGLYKSYRDKLQLLQLPKNEYVISVFSDNKQRIWFVTNGGGTYYLSDDSVYRFTEKLEFPSNWAYAIEQGSDNTIYVGTRNGLIALHESKSGWSAREISAKQGLSSNIVLALKLYKGNLWIGTENGNNRLALNALFNINQPISLKSFVYDNGYLASDSTLNSADIKENNIYWGSGSGVTYFNPNLTDSPANLDTQLLEVSSLNKTGLAYRTLNDDTKNSISIFSPDTVQIIIKFTHSDWAVPESIFYQTRLLGSSEQWSELTSSSQISYNHLSAGKYEFQVRAVYQNQIGEPISYHFLLEPQWWQTWWAYTVAVLILLLTMYVAMKLRFDLVRKQQRIKDRAQFSEALLARKKQLLAEVSHEIRTPLSVLKMQIEGLEHNIVTDTEKTYELLHRRIGDINLLIADIDQLAITELNELTLNISNIDVLKWLQAWCTDAEIRVNQQVDKHFSYALDIPDELVVKGDSDRLMQVLTNLLSNSLRYTSPPASIQMQASYKNEMLTISMQDSSPGVSEEELTTIFERMYQSEKNRTLYKGGTGLGLSICQDIVSRHGGTIIAKDSELGGVNIVITLPENIW